MFCAALTGDVVRSTRLAPAELQQTLAAIGRAVEDFSQAFPGVLIGRPEFFRGDAWQLALAEPGRALRLALLIRARLRAGVLADTRISIGVGKAEIAPEQVSLSTGDAFVLSGRALDTIAVQYRMTGALPVGAEVLADWFPTLVHLCDRRVQDWKPQQAETVAAALLAPRATHEAIGKALRPPVVKQTVTDALRGAGWHALHEAVEVFEATRWPTLLREGRVRHSPRNSLNRLSSTKQD